MTSDSSPLYFRQLLAGRDFAQDDTAATQMRNFAYLIGDRDAKKCLVVDPAWDVSGLFDIARGDGMEIVGALATHYHPDHIGGELFGFRVEGLASLQEAKGIKVHCHREEAAGIRQVTGLSQSDLETHDGGDHVEVGAVRVELLHTPGHTPGSQCFLVDGRLVAGDTLFVEGCGRVDLPGGDPEEMYRTLTQRLATLPSDTILFPGHDYGPVPSRSLGEERSESYYLQPRSLEDWMRLMG